MHRTSARPAPLHFPLSLTNTTNYGIDRRKEFTNPLTLPHLIPGYLEAPIRDGLRTPPADEMGTTYQQPQYNNYAVKQEGIYPTPAPSGSVYSSGYSVQNGQGRPYSTLGQPTPASNSSLRNEVLPSQSYHQTTSPQINKTVSVEGLTAERRKSTNGDASAIVPNLQIPKTINDSEGSLAEFAAQVNNAKTGRILLKTDLPCRLPAYFGLNLKKP